VRWLVLALVLLAAPRAALAFDFEDDAAGFSMTVDPAVGERLCVAWPKGHADPIACAGFDVEAFERIGSLKQGPVQPVAVGALRRGDRTLLIIVQRDDSGGLDVGDADEYVKGVVEGTTERTGGTVDKKAHRVVRVADRDAVELELEIALPPGSPLETLFGVHRYYGLPAGKVGYSVTFSSGRIDKAWVEAVAKRVTATIQADAARSSKSRSKRDRDDDDDDRSAKSTRRKGLTPFEQGELVGRGIAIVGMVALVVWLIVRFTRKKPPPTHPQGHWGAQPPPHGQQPWGPYPPQPPPPQQQWGQPPHAHPGQPAPGAHAAPHVQQQPDTSTASYPPPPMP